MGHTLTRREGKGKKGASEYRDPNVGEGTTTATVPTSPSSNARPRAADAVASREFDCVLFGETLPGARRARRWRARRLVHARCTRSRCTRRRNCLACVAYAGGDAPVVEINATRAETPAEADIVVAAKAAETLRRWWISLELRKESAGDATPAGGGGGEGGHPQMFARPRMF